jgi:hypothetical protein
LIRFVAIAVPALAGTYPAHLRACSCAPETDNVDKAVAVEFERASAVLVATVESVERTQVLDRVMRGDAEGEITQFVAGRSWKGTHGKRLYSRIATECCTCGRSFDPGKSYLLYLFGPDAAGYYVTGICSRTRSIELAGDDIGVLDRLVPEETRPAADSDSPRQ